MACSGVAEIVIKLEIPKLKTKGLYIIKSLPDGSCFFHSLLRAFHYDYITATNLDERKSLARKLRNATAESLEEKNPTTGRSEYESMGNGYYNHFNEAVKDVDGDKYSLAALQKELRGDDSVSHAYIEILGNYLDMDIYLISSKTGDVYLTGTDINLIYKRRKSMIILYSPGHYDTLAIKRNCEEVIFDALFSAEHPLVCNIRDRINNLAGLDCLTK